MPKVSLEYEAEIEKLKKEAADKQRIINTFIAELEKSHEETSEAQKKIKLFKEEIKKLKNDHVNDTQLLHHRNQLLIEEQDKATEDTEAAKKSAKDSLKELADFKAKF